MASWDDLEHASPTVAAGGRAALFRGGVGEGFLTTVAGSEGLPRTHVVNIGIVDGRLLVFVQAHSAKARDLAVDGRFALHAYVDPAVPHEFLVRGRAEPIVDDQIRAAAMAVWPFRASAAYPLYELRIAHALYGERPTADDWPPRYTSWRAPQPPAA